jgi:hypothetical protein
MAIGVGLAGAARAADIPITGLKLVIVDKLNVAGKAKAVFVAKHPGVTKGSGTDETQISAEIDVSYDSASGVFLAPQGSQWLANKSTVAKYVNKAAPTGGATKVALIKPGKLLKLVAKSLGDTPIDISTAPSGGVLVVYEVTNGAETNRHCTSFPICSHKQIAGNTGYKLVCKIGDLAACPGPPTTTSSTIATTTSSSTTTTTSSSTTTTTAPGIVGPSFPPNGGTVSFAFSGAPSPGDPGGTNVAFTSFDPDTTWSELYWGPSSAALPTAGLDGSPHALTFSGGGGTTAIWAGTSGWTDPMDSTFYPAVPIELRITISGLGPFPWTVSTSVPGLDPGPGTGIGAVVDNSASFLDFTANVQFLADLPTDGSGNFIALNSAPGGMTNSSFSGGFYSVVP